MKILSMAQYDAKSAEEQAEYDTKLESYLTEFEKAADENGVVYATITIKRTAHSPVMQRSGRMRINLAVDTNGNKWAKNVVSESGNIHLAPKQANVLATSAGFANWGHFSISCLPCLDKGQFRIGIVLNREGESWTSSNGDTGTYKTTGLSIESYEFLPSVEVAGMLTRATQAIAIQGFADVLGGGNSQGAVKMPPAGAEAEEEEAEVNP